MIMLVAEQTLRNNDHVSRGADLRRDNGHVEEQTPEEIMIMLVAEQTSEEIMIMLVEEQTSEERMIRIIMLVVNSCGADLRRNNDYVSCGADLRRDNDDEEEQGGKLAGNLASMVQTADKMVSVTPKDKVAAVKSKVNASPPTQPRR